MAKIGTLIDGKYEVLREIGRGGMSVVYLAMDTRLNKQWAIKEIARKANDANNDIVVSSLLAEANLMKKLDHPALPRIVDIIEEQNTIYVVMDYIEGEPLSKILELYGAQDQDTVIEWGKQLCDVLFYLHNCEPPIIYRDMKPANVMLKPDGTVKLIDFGIAREYKRSKTADTESLGTRGYAAPEQFGGKGQTDARTDIYCFGVTLYHLVTGLNPCEPPYELYPIKQINPNYYDGLQYLIQKCIQMNPEDRFQSCDEIRYVLDNIQEFDKGRRIGQKKKFSAFITMTVLSLVFALLGTGVLAGGRYALASDFEKKLESVVECDDYTKLYEYYTDVIVDSSGLDSDDKLKFMAAYVEAVDRLSNDISDINQVLPKTNIVDTYVEDYLITQEKADEQYDGNRYAELTVEQRTDLALYYYYLGKISFKSSNVSSSIKFSDTKTYLSYLFDTNKLDLLSGKYEYDMTAETGFSDENIQFAQNYYYSALIYTIINAEESSSNPLYTSNAESNDDIADYFPQIIESVEKTESNSNENIKRSMYQSYYSMLEKQNRISTYKEKQISVDDVDAIYIALYGESYKSVYEKAIKVSGGNSVSSLTKEQSDNLEYNKNAGIYSISWPDSVLNTFEKMKDDRVNIADYIHQVYGE